GVLAAPRAAPVLEEIAGASLVDDVEQRPGGDQDDHEDDIALHEAGRKRAGERGEWIGCEHETSFGGQFYGATGAAPDKKGYAAIDALYAGRSASPRGRRGPRWPARRARPPCPD